MKKLWFMLAMMICILASCSDGGSEEPVNPSPKPEEVKTEITIDSGIISNGLSFGVTEGEQSISFSVNANWTLSVASTTSGVTWCKASATSGSKGSATVKFTVDENTGYDDRSVSVTIKAGSVSKTFTITQKGADALLVTTTKYEVVQEGGQIEIEVKANISYQMEISEEAKGWITEAESKGRALTTTKHKLNIAMNENAEKREGDITFKSGDKVETVKVYQAGGAILLLSQNEYTVSDAGDTISVDIKSNIDFGIQMPDVDWISDEASSRGMSSHTLKYIVSANETYDSRSAEIIFYDKNSDLKDTLKVVQAQKDAIIISEKNISVVKEGGTVEVKVNTNVDFEVHIPSDTTWISQTDSRALTEKSVYLKVTENKGEKSRSVIIRFYNRYTDIEELVNIQQEGNLPQANISVTVTEPGTLNNYIDKDRLATLSSIKIIGSLNADDFNTIYSMRKLEVLDLSDATIIGGGSMRSIYFSQLIQGNFPNVTPILEDNTIVGGMINSNVNYFYAPKNITCIRGTTEDNYVQGQWESIYTHVALSPFMSYYWFLYYKGIDGFDKNGSKGSNLKYIELPDDLKEIGASSFRYTDLDEFVVPKAVEKIRYAAFAGSSLKKIYLNDGLKEIEGEAFADTELQDLAISRNVEIIGERAFYNCPVSNIKISSSLKKIGYQAFGTKESNNQSRNIYITDLSHWLTLDFGDDESNPMATSSKSNLYLNNRLLSHLTIPDNIEYIKPYVFLGCHSIESISINNQVDSIGIRAFEKCVSTKNVNIGSGVKIIKESAFYDCENLYKVTLGEGLKEVESGAFGNTKPTEVYCYATTPPSIVSFPNFDKIDKKTAKLYIPKGTYSAYYLSNWGSIFTNIIEMD